MALEPAEVATPSLTPQSTALEKSLLGGLTPAAPAAPAAPEPVAPPAPEPVAPEPVTPLKEIEKLADPPDLGKLPIDDVEDDAPPEPVEKGDKVGRRIEALKTEIKATWKPKVAELEQTKAQLEAQLLELKGSSGTVEELRQKIASYETEMSVVKLERTEAFKETYQKPMDAIESKAREIAETYGLEIPKLFQAFAATEEKDRRALLKETLSGLEIDDDDRDLLRDLIRDAQPLYAKRDELYANADKALLELEARKEKETAEQASARAEERVRTTDLVVGRIASKLPFLKEIVSGVADTVKSTNLENVGVEMQTYNALAGETLPKVAKMVRELQNERDQLLDELAAYRKASPRIDGGFRAAAAGESKPKTLEAALLAGIGG